MRAINSIAWQRLMVISAIVGDVNGRAIATLFYFTILVPFGIGSALFSDPLRIKQQTTQWIEREPVPTDLESAREQG